MHTSNRCPRCRGGNVRRSRRRSLIDTLVSKAGFMPFRCLGCNHRFFSFRSSNPLRAPQSGKC